MILIYCITHCEDLSYFLRNYAARFSVQTRSGYSFEVCGGTPRYDIQIGLDGRGRCLDNAKRERFWRSPFPQTVYDGWLVKDSCVSIQEKKRQFAVLAGKSAWERRKEKFSHCYPEAKNTSGFFVKAANCINRRLIPASVNLIYDSEILICNQYFPGYLTLIDCQSINMEKVSPVFY